MDTAGKRNHLSNFYTRTGWHVSVSANTNNFDLRCSRVHEMPRLLYVWHRGLDCITGRMHKMGRLTQTSCAEYLIDDRSRIFVILYVERHRSPRRLSFQRCRRFRTSEWKGRFKGPQWAECTRKEVLIYIPAGEMPKPENPCCNFTHGPSRARADSKSTRICRMEYTVFEQVPDSLRDSEDSAVLRGPRSSMLTNW